MLKRNQETNKKKDKKLEEMNFAQIEKEFRKKVKCSVIMSGDVFDLAA